MAAEPGGYRDRLRRSAAAGKRLRDHQPELHESYWRTHDLAMADGALDRKAKELIGLALVVAEGCEVCIAFHVRDCLAAGATDEEVFEALNVVVMQGSGPAMVHAGYAVEALEEYRHRGGRTAASSPPDERHLGGHHGEEEGV